MKTATRGQERFVLFADNLTGQQADEFKEAVAELGGVVWYLLKNCTDIVQPVDAGVGDCIKKLIQKQQREWLSYDANADRWYGNQPPAFSASERRILMCNWAGRAYEIFVDDYAHLRARSFRKTGCLMTADGSEDDQVHPEGLPDYKMPGVGWTEPTITGVKPQFDNNYKQDDPDDEPPDTQLHVDEGAEEVLPDLDAAEEEQTSREDAFDDRDYNHPRIGKRICIHYENGWESGTVKYYNRKLKEYKIVFASSKEPDYVAVDDIDGQEVYFPSEALIWE